MRNLKFDMLPRPYIYPSGYIGTKLIHVCECPKVEKRGKEGGVCGKCGFAIPNEYERKLFKVD